MALETLLLLEDKTSAQEIARTIAKRLSDKRWMSTQSTSYSLLAMAKFANYIGGKSFKVAVNINGKETIVNSQKTLAERALKIEDGNNALAFKNNGDNTVFARIITTGILPIGEEKEIQRNLKAIIRYKARNGSTIDVSKIPQGTDFIAEVTITNLKGEKVKDIALSEIFPSGWEIVNTRFTDFGSFAQNNVTYTDLRDDRANFYFDLKKNESKTMRILLNASYLGKYYLPGIQCEAMYDNDFTVRTRGQWVEVVK